MALSIILNIWLLVSEKILLLFSFLFIEYSNLLYFLIQFSYLIFLLI